MIILKCDQCGHEIQLGTGDLFDHHGVCCWTGAIRTVCDKKHFYRHEDPYSGLTRMLCGKCVIAANKAVEMAGEAGRASARGVYMEAFGGAHERNQVSR